MFKLFGKLPKELRLEVWDTFLEQESSHRMALVNTTPVYNFEPRKQLVSPLLTINKESCYCALRYYTYKVDYIKDCFEDCSLVDDCGLDTSVIIGSLYLNLQSDIMIMNYTRSCTHLRECPAAVAAATGSLYVGTQVYYAPTTGGDIEKFKSLLSAGWEIDEPLSFSTVSRTCICWCHSTLLWDDIHLYLSKVERYLLVDNTIGPNEGWKFLYDFQDDLYKLDNNTMWEKYNIREFAWALRSMESDDKANLALRIMVDINALGSSTMPVTRGLLNGHEANFLVLNDEQTAEVDEATEECGCGPVVRRYSSEEEDSGGEEDSDGDEHDQVEVVAV
ncbi:hypothetical protein PG995_006259 [Apiospora arundinis]